MSRDAWVDEAASILVAAMWSIGVHFLGGPAWASVTAFAVVYYGVVGKLVRS